MIPFNIDPDDEDNPLIAAIAEQQRRHEVAQLEYEEKERNAHDLFDHLSETDLRALKEILSGIIGSGNPQAAANYWRGYAKANLKARFGVKPYKESITEDDFDRLLRDD